MLLPVSTFTSSLIIHSFESSSVKQLIIIISQNHVIILHFIIFSSLSGFLSGLSLFAISLKLIKSLLISFLTSLSRPLQNMSSTTINLRFKRRTSNIKAHRISTSNILTNTYTCTTLLKSFRTLSFLKFATLHKSIKSFLIKRLSLFHVL